MGGPKAFWSGDEPPRISAVTISSLPERTIELTLAVNGSELQSFIMSHEIAASIIAALARGIVK